MKETETNNLPETADHECLADQPVVYHPTLEAELSAIASSMQVGLDHLRQLTERAIRSRYGEVLGKHGICGGDGVALHELDLGLCCTYFALEPHAFIVRGYMWQTPGCWYPSGFIVGFTCLPE